MADQADSMCEQLVQAVTAIMEPDTNQHYRMEALKFCEDFKENCPLCVPCGLKLADKMQLPVVRHFGLQVLEHVIKFRWNNMSSEDKLCLKYSVMELISNGMNSVLEEEAHIKDVFARIIVEMIKREWPQNWPDMLNELEALTKQGEVQTELVMFILLRLAEDVVTFHTLPPQRRRDIHLTMMQNMDKLFAFMLNILQENVTQYQHLNDTGQKGQSLCRVAVAALNTLAGYMDWVPIAHIVADNCKLLEGLCVLLSEPELQVEAAECLIIAVSRKGRLEDREPLMILFEDSAMNSILSAAQMADVEGLVEKSYIFLKRLCQVLCALGNQICALTVAADPHAKVPVNFGKYLNALLAFTRHPSLFLKSSTLMTWGSLYRHELLSKDPQLLAAIPKFLQISMTSVVKVGFPSKNDSPSCEYSRLDFDCDEDFNTSYGMFLSWMTTILKAVCRLDPHTSFHMAGNWLRFMLTAPVDEEPQTFNPGKASGSPLSSTHAQWEAMTFFSEGIIRVAFGVLCEEQGRVAEGIDVLHSILTYEATDPVILSCVLTNLSSYFPFIRYTNPSMPLVLSKLFAAISFHTSANSKDPLTRAVKNVRRHACCSLIKICSTYPELVLPHFELLYTQVKHLLKDERFQSQMERCSAMEALVLVSNQLKDYEKQKSFLMEFISPLMSVWLSEDVQRAISSPEALISFVGAAASTNLDIEEDPCRLNRTQLSFCSFGILRMIMRAHWPSDIEEAKTGGFLVGYTPTGTPIFRHPCSEAVLKLVDSVVALIRTHNGIYHLDVLAKMGALSKAVEIMEIEKRPILGLPPLEPSYTTFRRNLLERLQGFFCSSYDNCYQILGGCGTSLQQDFYSIPNLVPHLLNSAFTNLDNVPDFRLRVMLRRFVKPFILSCPPERYGSIVIPILGPLLNYMQQRLSQKWLFVNQQDIVSEEDECKEESVEILEDLLLRLLSREVMDLIIACCVAKKNQSPSNAGADGLISATQVEVEDEEMMASDTTNPGTVELTELGRFLMGNEDLSTVLLVTVFSPLVWKDTISCQKAAVLLCWPLLTQVISSSLPSDAAVCFFTNVLRGLQMHGQHEGCLSVLVHLAFQIYEALRPHYPALRSVMEQVPEIQKQSLDQFDSQLLFPKQKMADKRRKDHFKRLITGCIGKPLGEQFRKEIHIRNLPALFQKKSKTQLDVDPILENCDDSLPALFKP